MKLIQLPVQNAIVMERLMDGYDSVAIQGQLFE